MSDDGSIDTDGLESVVERLVTAGIDGLVPCGTTGEFAALTDDERRTVIETTVEAADSRVPVMAGVGATSVADVRRHVRDADAAGADSVLVAPPYYGGQASANGNETFFRSVLDETPLPVYLYNVPQAVGQELQVETVVSLAEHDDVVGIKDSSGDVTYVGDVLRRTPDDFAVFQGWDAGFVPALSLGADGGINALAHLSPEAFSDAADAVAEGDVERARAHQFETIDPAFEFCREHGFAPSVKAALDHREVIRSATVRPPQEPLTDHHRDTLVNRIE